MPRTPRFEMIPTGFGACRFGRRTRDAGSVPSPAAAIVESPLKGRTSSADPVRSGPPLLVVLTRFNSGGAGSEDPGGRSARRAAGVATRAKFTTLYRTTDGVSATPISDPMMTAFSVPLGPRGNLSSLRGAEPPPTRARTTLCTVPFSVSRRDASSLFSGKTGSCCR